MQIDELVITYARTGQLAQDHVPHSKPEIKFLLELVDTARKHAQPASKLSTNFQPISHPHFLTLLEDIFSDNFSKKEAKIFLDQLIYNPNFLYQLEPYLTAPENIEPLTDAEKAQCIYLSDEEILNRVTETLNPEPKYKHERRSFPFWADVKEGLTAILSGPRIATAVVTVILLVGSALLLWPQDQTAQVYKAYFVNQEPYAGRLTSTMRSGSQPSEDLINLLTIAQSNYLSGDFSQAIQVLNSLHQHFSTLDEPSPGLKRDTYFYLGMSYLGRSRGKNMSDVENAILYLKKSIEYSQNSHDQVSFFVGLAYSLADQPDKAETYLSSINPNSSFYNSSIKLLD